MAPPMQSRSLRPTCRPTDGIVLERSVESRTYEPGRCLLMRLVVVDTPCSPDLYDGAGKLLGGRPVERAVLVSVVFGTNGPAANQAEEPYEGAYRALTSLRPSPSRAPRRAPFRCLSSVPTSPGHAVLSKRRIGERIARRVEIVPPRRSSSPRPFPRPAGRLASASSRFSLESRLCPPVRATSSCDGHARPRLPRR